VTFSFASLLLGAAFAGMAVGALVGLVVCQTLKLTIRRRALIVDGVVGAVGLPLAYAALLRVPWQHTSLYYAEGTIITTTTLHYQHPIAAACGVAIVLPALHALGRFYAGKDRRRGS
jgi:hypothetical protein